MFRPPYGDYDSSVIATAKALGLATILWDVDPSDWALPGVAAIEQRVLAQVRSGSIIISHDGGGPRGETLAAYPHIIDALRRRGYRFETVPQLLGFHTVYERCGGGCDGEGVKAPLPAGSVVDTGAAAEAETVTLSATVTPPAPSSPPRLHLLGARDRPAPPARARLLRLLGAAGTAAVPGAAASGAAASGLLR